MAAFGNPQSLRFFPMPSREKAAKRVGFLPDRSSVDRLPAQSRPGSSRLGRLELGWFAVRSCDSPLEEDGTETVSGSETVAAGVVL